MTIATDIADRHDNDGQTWTDENGKHLESLVKSHDRRRWTSDDAIIAVFDDSSAILMTADFWDVLERGRDGGGHRWMDDNNDRPSDERETDWGAAWLSASGVTVDG